MTKRKKNEEEKKIELSEIGSYEAVLNTPHEDAEIEKKRRKDFSSSWAIFSYLVKEMCCGNKKNFFYTLCSGLLAFTKTGSQVCWPFVLDLAVNINQELEGAYPDCEFGSFSSCNFGNGSYLSIGFATFLISLACIADFLIPIFTTNLSKSIARSYISQLSQELVKGPLIDSQQEESTALDINMIQDALHTRITSFFIDFLWYVEIILRFSILLLYFTNRLGFWMIGVFICVLFALAKYIFFPIFVQNPSKAAEKKHVKELEELNKYYEIIEYQEEKTRENTLIKIEEKLNKVIREKTKAKRNSNIITVSQGFFINILMMIIIFYTTYLIQKGEPNDSFLVERFGIEKNYIASDLSLILSNFLMITIALLVINQSQPETIAAEASLEKALRILELRKDIKRLEGTLPFPTDTGKGFTIFFNNVSLDLKKNNSGEIWIKNLSFSLEPSSITGLASTSDSGKTKILKLLYKLYLNYEGNIQISNNTNEPVELRDIRLDDLRENVIYFPKKYKILYSKSLRENLRFFDAHAEDEFLREVLQSVGLLVDGQMPELDMMPDDFTHNQKHRLSLAQAFVKISKTKAKILIYNQDISTFPEDLQKEFLGLLDKLKHEGATVLFVPPEVKFLKKVDKIIFFKKTHNKVKFFTEESDLKGEQRGRSAYALLQDRCADFKKMDRSEKTDNYHSINTNIISWLYRRQHSMLGENILELESLIDLNEFKETDSNNFIV